MLVLCPSCLLFAYIEKEKKKKKTKQTIIYTVSWPIKRRFSLCFNCFSNSWIWCLFCFFVHFSFIYQIEWIISIVWCLIVNVNKVNFIVYFSLYGQRKMIFMFCGVIYPLSVTPALALAPLCNMNVQSSVTFEICQKLFMQRARVLVFFFFNFRFMISPPPVDCFVFSVVLIFPSGLFIYALVLCLFFFRQFAYQKKKTGANLIVTINWLFTSSQILCFTVGCFIAVWVKNVFHSQLYYVKCIVYFEIV